TNWQILLSTEQPENEIRDVFIFVEDECELHIDQVANYSIIDLPEIKALIEKAASSNIMLRKEDFKQEQWQSQQQSKEQVTDKSKGAANKEHKISSIRVSSHKIDQLVNLVSELVTLQAQLELYADQHEDPAIASISENVQKLSRQLRENAFEISLIPLQSELMRFQRLVRDLSKEQGKEIDFIIEGGELELDKNIIEHLTDPILHILRNSIDHGIELPDERIAAGKSPKGIIHFKAYHSGANVFIEITDDGKGIDASVIRQKAISKGILDADTQMSDKEVMDLIFVSGFSTRDVVSGVSGRGVGMDVVRRKIAGIRGEVSVESELGKGTLISIKLPLTLSIIDGLLVAVGNSRYVIPISSIDKIYSLAPQDLKRSFNNVIQIDNQQKPFLDLREVFNVNRDAEIEDDVVKMIMVKSEDKYMGLVVDAIVGEYQTVVKPLGRYLRKQKIVSGASIMGDGTIALVIDTSRMVQHRKSSKVSAV
ncbi:MAG TPA: chemotaxis protein CheA, partial [Bacteroidales bacterium]|nr:chemotaxis protein CheA [Bacteroidales bacterium]